MKILKEAKKESIPASFITDFISNGWNTVGYLQAGIEGVKQEFKGTTEIVDTMQDLVDAYLICIGKLEGFLKETGGADLKAAVEAKESLKEDTNITLKLKGDITPDDVVVGIEEAEPEAEAETALTPCETTNVCEKPAPIGCAYTDNVGDLQDKALDAKKPIKACGDPFEFYVEFDDPEPDTSPVSPLDDWKRFQQNKY